MKSFAAVIWAAIAALLLSACANDNAMLKAQADATAAVANARVAEAQAAAEQAKAVQALAPKIDAGGASAYLIATAMKGMAHPPAPQVQVQQPQSMLGLAWQSVLQVADIALRGYGIKSNRDVQIVSSNNNRDVALGSYNAFAAMGGQIATAGTAGYPYVQAPAANVTTTTLSGQGVIGNGTYTGPVTTTTTHTCPGGTTSAGNGTTTGGPGGSAAGGTC